MLLASFYWNISPNIVDACSVCAAVIVIALGLLMSPRWALTGGLLGAGLIALFALSSGVGDMGDYYMALGVPAFGVAGGSVAALIARTKRGWASRDAGALVVVLVWAAILIWAPNTGEWWVLRMFLLIPLLFIPLTWVFGAAIYAIRLIEPRTDLTFEGHAVALASVCWITLCGIVAVILRRKRPPPDGRAESSTNVPPQGA